MSSVPVQEAPAKPLGDASSGPLQEQPVAPGQGEAPETAEQPAPSAPPAEETKQ